MSSYNDCMTPAMKQFPKGIPKEERSLLFCMAAKKCSGKITNEAEARSICSQPKAPKPPKARKSRSAPGAATECPVCDVSNLMPRCVDILANELPTDIGINPERICKKVLGVK